MSRGAFYRIATLGLFLAACVEPPPKIAAIPAGGLSLRVYVFGASADDAKRTFAAAHRNNDGFHLVDDAGDADLVVGLENDSPACVAPTAFCSFRVAYRVRDKEGSVIDEGGSTMSATASSCTNVCAIALRNVATKLIETAAVALGAPAVEEETTANAKTKRSAFCALASGARLPSNEAEKRTLQVETLKRLNLLAPREYDCLRKAYLERL